MKLSTYIQNFEYFGSIFIGFGPRIKMIIANPKDLIAP